jgi:uncharacterized protein (DUF58 family)
MTNSTPALPLSRAPLPEFWKRSLIAVLGLGFSFAAALFSTVTRESGNMAATAILAGASLLVSVWVGMTTVPSLARRVVSGVRWRDSFDFELTRAGIVYVLATLLIGVAALNTGNNLLYLIISTMLAAVLVSGVCSSLVLGGLGLSVTLPRHVFAGERAPGSLELRNSRRWLPSLSITIVPPTERKAKERWRIERGTFGFPPNWPPERQWLSLTDANIRRVVNPPLAPAVFQGAIHFALIPPRSSAKTEIELCFQRRGLYRQDAFVLLTAFPFGLLVKRRSIEVSHELIVYPTVDSATHLSRILPSIAADLSSMHVGTGQDLLRIRAYEAGESARHVDWKATAKSGALKVREFARDEEAHLRIVFDNPAPGEVSEESYEHGIRLAASLAWHFARVPGQVSFVASGFGASSNVMEFLRYLALAQPAASSSVLEELPETGAYNVIVTVRSEASISPALRSVAHICRLQRLEREAQSAAESVHEAVH